MKPSSPARRSLMRAAVEIGSLLTLLAAAVAAVWGYSHESAAEIAARAPVVHWDESVEAAAARGRNVAATTPGFRFKGVETFSGERHPKPIAVLIHESTRLEFSLIPAGSASLGSPPAEAGAFGWDRPVRRVTIAHPFLIARTECTRRAWRQGGGAMPTVNRHSGDEFPVADVDWKEARDWCARLGLRLPTEAEWEYACRAGTSTRFWSGDDESSLMRVAWYGDTASGEPRRVQKKLPNAFGLHDVHGNVWEWCEDSWRQNRHGFAGDGGLGPSYGGDERNGVVRGGSWRVSPRYLRSGAVHPVSREGTDFSGTGGFRPAASVGAD